MNIKTITYFFVVVFAFSFPQTFFCQNKQLDSLKLALKNTKNDSVKCIILDVLAETASDEEGPMVKEARKDLAEIRSATASASQKNYYLKYFSTALNS